MNGKKYAAEAIGTFWLTFAGCGSAVIAAAFPQVGIGLVGVSLAFGLSVVTMALCDRARVGLPPQSRGHGGPRGRRALSGRTGRALYRRAGDRRDRRVGFAVCDRERRRRIRCDKRLCVERLWRAFAGQYGEAACFIMEVVMTMMFLFIIMGATHGNAPAGFAPLAIGLAL